MRTAEHAGEGSRAPEDAQRSSSREATAHDASVESENVRDDAASTDPVPAAPSDREPPSPEQQSARAVEIATHEVPEIAGTAAGSASKDTTAPEVAQDVASSVLPSGTILPTAAFEMLEKTQGLESRIQALLTSSDGTRPEPQPIQASVKSVTKADESAPSLVVDSGSPANHLSAHEVLDLARDARSSPGSMEIGSPAIAAVSGRTPATADVAALAAPSMPRLFPAELPQYFETLQVRVDGAAGNAFVELEPPELGRLTVELSLQPDGGVRADVRVENQDGFAALGARVQEMRTALLDRGFATAEVQISLGLAERETRRDSDSRSPRRSPSETAQELKAEHVIALATSGGRSIDVWA